MRSRRALTKILALSTLVVAAAIVRPVSRRYIFPRPHRDSSSTPMGFVADAFQAKDGTTVRTLTIRADGATRTVVHFHNNRATIEDEVDFARGLHERGLDVVLVEYRGYGGSGGAGAPDEEGLYLDAEAALDHLAERGIGPERITLSGASLGTGVAAEMAHRGRGSRLVLVTPYTSIPDLVTNVAPFVPARVLIGDRFETLAKAAGIRIPTLVVHGDADEIVPYAMGEQLSRALCDARLLRVPGGHHGDLFLREGARLLAAIAELAKG